ncbi:MAG: HlyC/CorC family transporter [Gemmatimonadota bacterium]|nr:HlyC/CorC family transporter [Gemmatimonadota bacterium]
MAIRLILIAVLLAVNGFFVAAEFALVRSRRSRLEAMARRGGWRARLALRAEENLPRILSTTQIGVTIASLAIGALAEDALGPAIAAWLGGLPWAIEVGVRVAVGGTAALIVVTYFTVVLAELMPRGISLGNPEGMAAWLTPPLLLFAWFTAPFSWLLNRSAQFGLRLVGLEPPKGEENVHSAEELRILVEQSQEKGVLLPQDAHLIEGVFEFSEKNAREVMTPRTDLDALPVDATLDDALAMVEETHRSRYPVYEDTIDNVVGLVLAKDLIPVLHHPPAAFSLRAIMRPVHVVPGSREVEDVLADFKRLKEHMAIVLDEYGGTAGVVTMEDLLEEIVGEILDEYDEPLPPETLQAGDVTLVPGAMNVGEFNERFALSVPEADYTTIGGFVFGALGRLPVVGDRITAHGAAFTVRELDGRRIETLAVKVTGAAGGPEDARPAAAAS